MRTGVGLGIGVGLGAAVGDDSGTVSASLSTLELDETSIPVGGSLTATVTARNAEGDVLESRPVTVFVVPDDGIVVTGSGNTDGSGVATRTITGNDAGFGFTVRAIVGGVLLDDAPEFTVAADTPSALQSSIEGAYGFPADLTPNPLTLTVRSEVGAPLQNIEPEGEVEQVVVDADASVVLAGASEVAIGEVCPITFQVVETESSRPLPGIDPSELVVSVSGTGNTVTQPSAPTDANGAGTASFSSTDAGAKTISLAAAGLTIVMQPVVTVTGSGSAIDPGSGDTTLRDDNFDGIGTISALNARLAAAQAGPTPWMEFAGPVPGSEREAIDTMIAPGYDGSSNAYRQEVNFATQIEPSMYGEIHRDLGESWATNPPGSTLFVDLWVRMNLTNVLWIKGLMLGHNFDRTQYGPYNSSAALGPWNIHPQSNNREIYIHLENGAADAPPVGVRRWVDVNDGDWHRWTAVYFPSSSPGATDGVVQLYIDGYKVIDGSAAGRLAGWMVDRINGVSASSTSPYPGNVGDKYTSVTGQQALEGLSDDEVSGRIIFPGIYRGLSASGGGTLDLGRYRVWYRP